MLFLRLTSACSKTVTRNSFGHVWSKKVSSTHSLVKQARFLHTNRTTQLNTQISRHNGNNGSSKSIASYVPKRVFTSKPTESSLKTKQPTTPDTSVAKERNATDLAIIKQLMKYIWPKNDTGVKARVVIALSLLVGGKVRNCEINTSFFCNTLLAFECSSTIFL